MTAILALLTNRWLAGALAAIALCAGIWIGGDVHGHRAQSRKDDAAFARVDAALQAEKAANTTNLATIASLKIANAEWADSAAASEARAAKAVQDVAAQRVASGEALARVNRKLEEAIHANQTNAAWGRACVPAGVFAAGGVQPRAGCPH